MEAHRCFLSVVDTKTTWENISCTAWLTTWDCFSAQRFLFCYLFPYIAFSDLNISENLRESELWGSIKHHKKTSEKSYTIRDDLFALSRLYCHGNQWKHFVGILLSEKALWFSHEDQSLWPNKLTKWKFPAHCRTLWNSCFPLVSCLRQRRTFFLWAVNRFCCIPSYMATH